MEPRELARLWLHNKRVIDEWMEDYGKRTGLSRNEIVAERQAHWIHDPNAEVIGIFHGFRLSVCPTDDSRWIYTIVTPWGMSEGLTNICERDDECAKGKLDEVIGLLKEVASEEREIPSKMSTVITPVAKTEPKPAKREKRGRPKGSKDTKPRKRRTKAQIARDSEPISTPITQNDVQETVLMTNEPEIASRGSETGHEMVPLGSYESTFISPVRKCIWIDLGDDRWLPRGIWEGYGMEYVISDGFFVPRPTNGIVCDDGDVPRPVIEAGMRLIQRETAA